jgi:hypothetical protein
MAVTYTVQLILGNSEGDYNIYYNNNVPNSIATLVSTGQPAINVDYGSLLLGVDVTVPDNATSIIVVGLACNNISTTTITPKLPTNIPPSICFSFGLDKIIDTYLTFTPDATLVNGKTQWSSGNYKITWIPVTNRWEFQYTSTVLFYSTVTLPDGTPTGSWVSIGANYTTNVTTGLCLVIPKLLLTLSSTPNSFFYTVGGGQQCDGFITATAAGGTAPYGYSLDGGPTQAWNTFSNVCPGTHTVTVIDNQGQTSTGTVVVQNGGQVSNLVIRLSNRTSILQSSATNSNRLYNWGLVIPTLNQGTIVDAILEFTNERLIGGPGTGSVAEVIEAYKNGVLLTPTITSSNRVRTRSDCTSSSYNETIVTDVITYLIDFTDGDVINGTCSSNLTLTTPQSSNDGCATHLNDNVDATLTVTSTNCINCTIQGFASTNVVSNSLYATTSATLYAYCLNYGNTCYNAANGSVII